MPSLKTMVRVEFTQSSILGDEPEYFQRRIKGNIYGQAEVEGREVDIPVGTMELVYVDVLAAIIRGISLLDFFDYDAVIDEYCSVMYDPETLEYSESAQKILGEGVFQLNTLILHRIMIHAKHRGKKIGQAALRTAIETLSQGCGAVAVMPKPFQNEAKSKGLFHELVENQLVDFEQDPEKARENLSLYYRRLGFEKLPGTNLLILNPSNPMPTLSQLGCPEDGIYELQY
ncbi:MAG: GNAT family N-acetyltransferase [Kiritimatiellia bacterium]